MTNSQINQYGEKLALQLLFGNATLSSAPTLYVAVLTATPTNTALTMADASITEYATASGYARQVFGPNTATSASPSVIQNNGTITFGPFTSAPGTCTWIAVVDAISGTSANIVGVAQLAASRTPAIGDSLVGAAGNFTFSW
jgi:hypothetical protein